MAKKKTRTSVYLDGELVAKAHDLGLNVSKVAENALKDAIERMEGRA
jgi:post-segregation antitoxin (ccd killing protein)